VVDPSISKQTIKYSERKKPVSYSMEIRLLFLQFQVATRT